MAASKTKAAKAGEMNQEKIAKGKKEYITNFKDGKKYKKTGKAGIFAGSLELVKEGNLTIKQENLFDEIYVKEIK